MHLISVGLAEIDITPDYPIRLSGYGVRREETTQVETRLRAKAMAIGEEKAALLLTMENCGVTGTFTERVAAKIGEASGVARERIVLCYSHTHTAPCLTGAAPMLFSSDIPPAHQAHIDQYTSEVEDKLVEVGLSALSKRKPGQLSFTQGHVGFAVNRRSQIGPVDHVLPMVQVHDSAGKLRAVWVSYACHCTTLGSEDNFICGDWAGYAQEAIEKEFPGALSFVTIGSAANANPYPRAGLAYAMQHGEDLAYEVSRLVDGGAQPISGPPDCLLSHINLPFETLPTRDEWATLARNSSPIGHHARKWLERMENGQSVPEYERYPIQTWIFDDDLVMVFLASEVVSDFTCRLRRLYDPNRLWVGAYANAFPGYIPSRRIWREGGYEGGDATVYFGMPNRYVEDVEDRILKEIQTIVPAEFLRE
jgi:hypothetical protein